MSHTPVAVGCFTEGREIKCICGVTEQIAPNSPFLRVFSGDFERKPCILHDFPTTEAVLAWWFAECATAPWKETNGMFFWTQCRGLHWWFVWGEHQKIRIIPPRWFIFSGFSRWGNCMIWREMCPCDTLQYFESLETDGPRPRFPSSNMFWPWQKACAQDLLAVVKHHFSCLISDNNMRWNGYLTQPSVTLLGVSGVMGAMHKTVPAHFVCPPCRLDRVDEWPRLQFSASLVFFLGIIWSQFSTRQVSPHSWYRFAQTQLCYKYYNASNLEFALGSWTNLVKPGNSSGDPLKDEVFFDVCSTGKVFL